MSQAEEKVVPVHLDPPSTPANWRTPGRKLTKEDLSATSILILGCSEQGCCDWPIEPNVSDLD